MNSVHVLADVQSLGWASSTGGALTRAQQRRLLRPILLGVLGVLRAFVPWRSRPPREPAELVVPDSRIVALAQEAAGDLPQEISGHGYRTWAFGSALSALDGAEVDPELLYVGALLHDAGLVSAVAGEDFTLRSAALALRACGDEVPEARRTSLANGIVAHLTPGLSYASDPLGYYIQTGALLDLAGARMRDLPDAFLRKIYARHPQQGMREFLVRGLTRERQAVPCGRAALLLKSGFSLAIHISPTRSF